MSVNETSTKITPSPRALLSVVFRLMWLYRKTPCLGPPRAISAFYSQSESKTDEESTIFKNGFKY
ncbi:MAG: hypothetical protein ACKOX6_18360, partial [Bdellovibrio sp.]